MPFLLQALPAIHTYTEIQALNREADMLILFSFVFILAFNKHSICTNCVPSSVFSSKYIRLSPNVSCLQGVHAIKGEKQELIKDNSTG